jgi:hypothetical protein
MGSGLEVDTVPDPCLSSTEPDIPTVVPAERETDPPGASETKEPEVNETLAPGERETVELAANETEPETPTVVPGRRPKEPETLTTLFGLTVTVPEAMATDGIPENETTFDERVTTVPEARATEPVTPTDPRLWTGWEPDWTMTTGDVMLTVPDTWTVGTLDTITTAGSERDTLPVTCVGPSRWTVGVPTIEK